MKNGFRDKIMLTNGLKICSRALLRLSRSDLETPGSAERPIVRGVSATPRLNSVYRSNTIQDLPHLELFDDGESHQKLYLVWDLVVTCTVPKDAN